MSLNDLPSDGREDRGLEEALRRKFRELGESAETAADSIACIQNEIRERIEFRLAETDEDLRNVLEVEKTLVIDPAELKKEFEVIRAKHAEGVTKEEMDDFIRKNTRFGRVGSHVYLNTLERLREVRQKGWVILAGLPLGGGDLHPIGYNYGLHEMPSGTKAGDPFHPLSKDTIEAHAREKEKIVPEQSAFNWRTGIAEDVEASVLRRAGIGVPDSVARVSLRRLGIASALKYLITSIAEKNGKRAIYFNIGTIYDEHSDMRIRNTPSYQHNTRYFHDDLGYRAESSFICMRNEKGEEEKVGEVSWRVRGDDELDDVLRSLKSEKSVLRSRNWDIDALERIAADMYDRMNADGHLPAGRQE